MLVVHQHALHDLLADGHGGVKARHGVLEHHGQPLAVVFRAQLLFRQLQQIDGLVLAVLLIGVEDFAAVDGGVAVQQAHGGLHGHGLARAALAHDGDGLALLQIQVHAADGVHHARVGAEGDIQILDLQDGLVGLHRISSFLTCLPASAQGPRAGRRR